MTKHEWQKVSESRVTDRSLGIPTRRVSVRWKCHRCGWGTILFKGFHPASVEDGIVAAGPDCDVALVAKVHMD